MERINPIQKKSCIHQRHCNCRASTQFAPIAMDIQQAQTPTKKIMMFPWLGYGHVSAFLELAKALSKRNFHIYFCSTPVNLDSIKPKLQFPSYSSIELLELHLPSFHDFPPHLHTANNLPSNLIPKLHQAFTAAAKPFEAFLQTLCPHLLIYDNLQPWALRLASSLNIPAINFSTTGISIFAHVFHNIHYPDSKFPFSDFVLHNHYKSKPNLADSDTAEQTQKAVQDFLYCLTGSRGLILVNSFKEIEGKYMDYLSVLLKKKVIPIGPLVYESEQNEIEEEDDEDYSRIKKWLDKKEPESTILVSFGSELFLSEEEMEEIGHGLEQSKANFIWVDRSGKGRRGFLEMAGDRAMAVAGWAPQGKILKHGSIGGFVSHCGWNSVIESVMFCVPVIGVPIHGDQPYNAGVLEESGVGVEVRRDSDSKIGRDGVAKLIKQVVVEKTREDVRKKVREISECLKRRSDEMIDLIVPEISFLCEGKSQL